jgi:hypothetical protein
VARGSQTLVGGLVEGFIGVGSIRNYLDKLMVEAFLAGLKSDPKISTGGLRLIYDFWPEEFSFTEQGRFVQSDDVPF